MLWRVLPGLLFIAGSVWTAAADERPERPERPRAFVELFTSQGCGACPPADRLVPALDAREDVVAVTMPVSLWDFLGWADTLATETLTRRQIAYASARHNGDVYTPQMVVNGVQDVLGSDESAIRSAIDTVETPLALPITLLIRNGVLTIDVGASEMSRPDERATLWLVVVEDRVTVPVGAGENRGRRLTYHNVVRHMRPVGMWTGEAMQFDLPLADLDKRAGASCLVLAQLESADGPGRVIGVAEFEPLVQEASVQR